MCPRAAHPRSTLWLRCVMSSPPNLSERLAEVGQAIRSLALRQKERYRSCEHKGRAPAFLTQALPTWSTSCSAIFSSVFAHCFSENVESELEQELRPIRKSNWKIQGAGFSSQEAAPRAFEPRRLEQIKENVATPAASASSKSSLRRPLRASHAAKIS